MEIVIMAGGEGRRMGALSQGTPKPMLPVGDRPLLQHLVERLRDQGASHVYLAVHHLHRMIVEHFRDGRWLGIAVDYLVETAPLGTAGALSLLPALTVPVLVMNGDVVARVPAEDLLRHHTAHDADITVGHAEHRIPVPFGVLESDGTTVVAVHEKPDVVLTVMAGVYVVSPATVASLPKEQSVSMPEVINGVRERGRVVGFPLTGTWLDVGTPEAYVRAEQALHETRGAPARSVRLDVPQQSRSTADVA